MSLELLVASVVSHTDTGSGAHSPRQRVPETDQVQPSPRYSETWPSQVPVAAIAANQPTSLPEFSQTANEPMVRAIAAEPVLPSPTPLSEPESDPTLERLTSVAQLSDVQPEDWAFQALQAVVERYNCLNGYPDRSFKGDRSLSRYEFAAGLNACLERLPELLKAKTANAMSQDEFAVLEALQTQFDTELSTLRRRVDTLEARTTSLEANTFSTTTRLVGQAMIGLQGTNSIGVDLFPRDDIPERTGQTELTVGYNLQVSLATSFRGNDLLLTGLQTGNLGSKASELFTNMGRLGYETQLGNQLVVSDLSYRFALGDRFGIIVGPAGVNPVNTFRGITPLEGVGDGAFSLFGQRNPILVLGAGTGGIGFDWQIDPRVSLQGIYSASLPGFGGDRTIGGLVGGRYTAGLQLSLAPSNGVDLGIHYLFSHSPDDDLGTGIGDAQLLSPFAPQGSEFNTHALGATIAWRVNSRWTVGAWGGWTTSTPISLSGSVETTNWMVFSAFPDLFFPGNLGAILIGQPPKITSSTLPEGFNFPRFSLDGRAGGQPDSALHLEAFYRLNISDSVSITPGLLVVVNPNHNRANGTLLVGALRATFQF